MISSIILLIGLVKWEFDNVKMKRSAAIIGAAAFLFLFFELSLYSPNFNSFSPMWLRHSAKINETPKQGEEHTGLPVMRGENVWMSAITIDSHYRRHGMLDREYNLYTDYMHFYLGKRNANTLRLADLTEEHFKEDSWFSYTRSTVYRAPIPPFISEVEPFFRIKFNGMTAMWIYRGDQLVDYMGYFGILE